jgi:hypothetical protein
MTQRQQAGKAGKNTRSPNHIPRGHIASVTSAILKGGAQLDRIEYDAGSRRTTFILAKPGDQPNGDTPEKIIKNL